MKYARRLFIKKVVCAGAAFSPVARLLARGGGGRRLKLALVGAGGMGSADADTALSTGRAELVAVCDLYDARLAGAKSRWGDGVFVSKDYRDILALENLDAVIIGTPDHWHRRIAVDALKSGRHVYCEKPVIHRLGEADALIEAQREAKGAVFLAGSQGMSSAGNEFARALVRSGIVGKVNCIRGEFSACPGDPKNYPIPADASEETIWWEQFLGSAPKIPFDPQKFFYWRNWAEYGTTIAGDLFVHVIASVHYIMGAAGPDKIYSTGGLRHYTEGFQNVPDVMFAHADYPDINGLGGFTLSLGANYVDGISKKWGSTDFRIIGEKGVMDVRWDSVAVKTAGPTETACFGALEHCRRTAKAPVKISDCEHVIEAGGDNRGGHYNHFENFFRCIESGVRPAGDAVFGAQTASVALLCYESYLRGGALRWDSENLKIV